MIARRFQLFGSLLAGLYLSGGATAQAQNLSYKVDLSVAASVQRPLNKGNIAPEGPGQVWMYEEVELRCDYKFTIPKESEKQATFAGYPEGGDYLGAHYFWFPGFRGAIVLNGQTVKLFDFNAMTLASTKQWSPEQWNSESRSFKESTIVTKLGQNEVRCLADVAKTVNDPNRANNSSVVLFTAAEDTPLSRAALDIQVAPIPALPQRGARAVSQAARPQLPPTAQTLPGEPVMLAPGRLVTQSVKTNPAQPQAGQKIQFVAVVQNEGGQPSEGLGVFGLCHQVTGNPPCPSNLLSSGFASWVPSLQPGQSHTVTLSPQAVWKEAGRYRLVVGTDVVEGQDARELELVVKASADSASAYVGVILEEGPVQHQDELGQPQGRTPRPVAPSAARVRADAPARTAVVSGSQVFTAPIWDGKRVDLCLVWGGQCGEPAATEFCKRSGYAKATEWKPAHDIGAQTPTVVLGTGQTCNQPFCDGFASITCSK